MIPAASKMDSNLVNSPSPPAEELSDQAGTRVQVNPQARCQTPPWPGHSWGVGGTILLPQLPTAASRELQGQTMGERKDPSKHSELVQDHRAIHKEAA